MEIIDVVKEARYLAALSLANELLKQELITISEYQDFENVINEKYRPVIGRLFAVTA